MNSSLKRENKKIFAIKLFNKVYIQYALLILFLKILSKSRLTLKVEFNQVFFFLLHASSIESNLVKLWISISIGIRIVIFHIMRIRPFH